MYVLEPVCKLCRWGVPYGELAAAIKKECPAGRSRIVVYDAELGGNLTRFFHGDEGHIELRGPKEQRPPKSPLPRDCTAFVWPASDSVEIAAVKFGVTVSEPPVVRNVDIPWRNHLWKRDGYRSSHWRVAPFRSDWTTRF
jgi:hypothetical protein